MTYNASEYCGSRHPYGRNAFAGNAAADAFVLISLKAEVPALCTAQDAGLWLAPPILSSYSATMQG